MQRIFKKYTIIIMTIAILSILVINFYFSVNSLERQQVDAFKAKIDQIIHTIENNQEELGAIKQNLDEDYLTRARAAAYVVEKNPDVLNSVEELRELAALLDVDELHVTESDAIIRYSSVPEYIGLDFHNGEQMRGFLPIFESDGEDKYIIQEAQPNTAEGKMMKYVGVSRKGVKGLVQVGLEPVRQMEAQERNTYDYIFSRFPTDVGEDFFAVDMENGEIVAYTGDSRDVSGVGALNIQELEKFGKGSYNKMENGEEYYIVTECHEDILIGASISRKTLFHTFWRNILLTFVYLFVVEVIAVLLLNYLVKQKVVKGIQQIRDALITITNGDLNTSVDVGGNPEFEDLSQGINRMVKSVVSSSDRISKIIDMSEIPLAAFEYQDDMKHVFVTSRLNELLEITEERLNEVSRDSEAFLRMVKTIMEHPEENENNVYSISSSKYVRIHFTVEPSGYYGAVTDVTKEILEKRRMLYENNHDQLTGLSRYAYFKQRAALILDNMEKGEVCACVMIDLDAFKKINDTYGHDVGDYYLQEFAGILKELPHEHCLVARRSGDEFCILAHGYKDAKEIEHLLAGFWDCLGRKSVCLAGKEYCTISASGGYTCTKGEKVEIESLLKQADQALYNVKRENKGQYST